MIIMITNNEKCLVEKDSTFQYNSYILVEILEKKRKLNHLNSTKMSIYGTEEKKRLFFSSILLCIFFFLINKIFKLNTWEGFDL